MNADLIAAGLSPLDPRLAAVRAGRLVLQEIDRLVADRADFAFETTLSGLGYARRIRAWKRAGYRVEMVYLKLKSSRLAQRRISARVREGGHDVPPSDVIRRFGRGWAISSVSTGHWRTRGRCMTILVKKPNCWKRTNDGKANPKSGTEVCREGWARPAPSCKRRAPNRPHAWCTGLCLEGRKDRSVEALVAKCQECVELRLGVPGMWCAVERRGPSVG